MKIYLLLALIFASGVLVFPSETFACACCADAGTYSISTKKPESFELDELKRLRFATANLYLTAGAEDNVRGISPLGESFSVDGLLSGAAWKFNFKDEKNKTGVLSLTKPVSMVAFFADLHDGADAGLGVKLYKEWRFKYRVQSASGIFQKGNAPATEYFLVLQGRGNFCTQAEDFTHWRLEVTGKKASFAFFGELKTAS